MDALQGLLPDTWFSWLTAVVALCALITTRLPAPGDNSNAVYRLAYRVIQWVAFNLGKAKNAQDVAAQKTIPDDGKR